MNMSPATDQSSLDILKNEMDDEINHNDTDTEENNDSSNNDDKGSDIEEGK